MKCPEIRIPEKGSSFLGEEVLLEKVKAFTVKPALDIVKNSRAIVDIPKRVVVHDVMFSSVNDQACPMLSREIGGYIEGVVVKRRVGMGRREPRACSIVRERVVIGVE